MFSGILLRSFIILVGTQKLYAFDGDKPTWVHNREWIQEMIFSPDRDNIPAEMGIDCESGHQLVPSNSGYRLVDPQGNALLENLQCPAFLSSSDSELEFRCSGTERKSDATNNVEFSKSTRMIMWGEAGLKEVPATKISFGQNSILTYCAFDRYESDGKPKRVHHDIKISCNRPDYAQPKSCLQSAIYHLQFTTSSYFADRLKDRKYGVISASSFAEFKLQADPRVKAETLRVPLAVPEHQDMRFISELNLPLRRDRNGLHIDYNNMGLSLFGISNSWGYNHLQGKAGIHTEDYWFNAVMNRNENDNYAKICNLPPEAGDSVYLTCKVIN